MWVQKLPNGKYKYNERFKIDGITGTVSVTLKGRSNRDKKMATDELARRIAIKVENKKKRSTKTYTLKHVAELYLAEYQETKKASSFNVTKGKVRILVDALGDVDINAITLPDCREALKRITVGKSRSTQVEYSSRLKSIFKFAFDNEYMESDRMFRKIQVKSEEPKTDITDKYFEPTELDSVLTAIRNIKRPNAETFADALEFCSLVGLRFGELAAIRMKNIDLNDQSILITETYSHNLGMFLPPKGNKERTAFMNNKAMKIAKKHAKTNAESLLFGNGTQPLKISTANRYLRMTRETINKLTTTHFFRHTFVTNAVQKGVPIMDIARQIGHTDDKMIKQVYAHFNQKMREQMKNNILNL